MRISGLLTVFFLLASVGLSQPTKSKASSAKPKPAATRQADEKKKAPAKAAKSAPKAAVKPKPKTPQTSTMAAKSASAKTKTPIPKAKPKAPPEPPQPEITDEEIEAEFQKAIAVETAEERIEALKKFIARFPKAKRIPDASAMIVNVHTQVANDMIAAGDMLAALESYEFAIKEAPTPIPDELFANTLAKFAPNLFFRGSRSESFHIAGLIEKKVGKSVTQLIGVANFYLSIENGSEARRIAQKAIKLDPSSSAAYQTLGLANRMDFLLEESAAAYVKAVQLDPESLAARRGLAEMRRALGQADDAVLLYKSIVEKDPADLASQTGLVLALFESNKRADAEAELARSLEANPGNVILQAGAAYWYATHGEGDKAVDLAQKAIATDPRFIWSHVALARGQTAQGNPVAAERTLIAARRYGNFPTIEYEIAAARASAGFYREAAEELAKSFVVKDGVVQTKLGGRVERSSKNVAELVSFERKASIFAPGTPDTAETGAQLTALLGFKQEIEKPEPNAAAIAKAAEEFAAGSDKMRVHRIIFAAGQMLDKKVALSKVVELAKAAPSVLDQGLEAPDPTAATLAAELYESRTIAAARGQFVNVPVIPKPTLSAILRGRVEELNGWAHYQLDDAPQASVHLRRAVSVLPADSAWWRSSTWRLGTALAVEGKNAEALDMYIRSYKSSGPDALKFGIIESLYKRVNGHTMGLEQRIGPNPSPTPSAQTVAVGSTPTATAAIPLVVKASPTPEVSQPPTSETPTVAVSPTASPTIEAAKAEPSPTPTAEPTPERIEPPLSPSPEQTPKTIEPTPTPEVTPEPSPSPTPEPTREPSPSPTPETLPTPESNVERADPKPGVSPTPEATPEPTPEATATPSPSPSPEPEKTPASTTVAKETAPPTRLDNSNGLFPPVVITIPPPPKTIAKAEPSPKPTENTDPEPKAAEPKNATPEGRVRVISGIPAKTEEIIPCTLTLDQDSINLQSGGNDRAVVVRRTDDGDIEGMTGTSLAPDDISVRREALPGVKWTALFAVRSTSGKAGNYKVRFETPCGKKEVAVKVQ